MTQRMLVLVVVAVLGWAGAAAASGFQTFEFDAAHIGQATAGMTSPENASVVATLPAAMVRMEGNGGSLAGITQYDPSYSAQIVGTPITAETQIDTVLAPHAYYVHNAQQWAWGAGLYFPYNVEMEWPASFYLNRALIKESLRTQYLSFSGAYAVNNELSFGASLIYIDAKANLQRLENVTPPGVDAPLELTGDTTKIGYNASALWDTGNLAVGFNYSPGYTLSADGNIVVGAPINMGAPATAELDIPTTMELGVSYRDQATDPNWRVELDLLQTAWSDFQRINITSLFPADPIIKNWDDTLGIKLGGHYVVARSGGTSHKVRAGVYLDESPIPPETLAPDVPDGEGRTEYAVGYGLKSGGLIVDLAYFIVHFKDSQTGALNPITTNVGAPTQFGGDVTIISASVGYQY